MWKNRSLLSTLGAVAVCVLSGAVASAHDTWVETNSQLVRSGDAVFIHLKLGNHGNDHRDFKLASKLKLDGATLDVHLPNGQTLDALDGITDVGYAPNEGYWTKRFITGGSGLYLISHSQDRVVNHGRPVRSVRSGKAFFLASSSLDKLEETSESFSKPLGHALEIVPATHPVLKLGAGQEIKVQVLLKNAPFEGARVSFIPEGETLAEGFDETYERTTDAEGFAAFTPKMGGKYLIVCHHKAPDESGDGYDSTSYSATFTMIVPELCPCCGL